MRPDLAVEYVLDTYTTQVAAITGADLRDELETLLRVVALMASEGRPAHPGRGVIIPAQPGWRLAILGRESETVEACPIVAWTTRPHGDVVALEPLCLAPLEQGLAAVELNGGASYEDRIVGIMPPGVELDESWVEAGRQLAEALREPEMAPS